MLNLLKRLFGIVADGNRTPPRASSEPGFPPRTVAAATLSPGSGSGDRRARGARATKSAVDRYFELSDDIERAKADRHFAAAARAARATYPLLPAVVREWKREYGSWDIARSHAVHTAPTLMAVIEDEAGIAELRRALEGTPALRGWLPSADQAEDDLALVRSIMPLVTAEPGLLQSTLKTRLGLSEGGRVSQLAAWLEKGGRLQRVKKGSSYQLYPAGYEFGGPGVTTASHPDLSPSGPAPDASEGTLRTSMASATEMLVTPVPSRLANARGRRLPKGARELDFARLSVVRLPMAPAAWEERAGREAAEGEGESGTSARGRRGSGEAAEPRFTVEGMGWSLANEVKLAPENRPDPAFKQVFHTPGLTHWLDPKGKREGYPTACAVLRVTDRAGGTVAERGLAHDIYRADVNADGSGILFLSREGVLHGYTGELAPFLEERLEDFPEYQAQANRLGIEPRKLKSHVRAVALSGARDRYLVTVVDEAWCVETTTGEVKWGLRMPTKEGWTRRVAERSERAGTSAEVEAALRLMELALPITPEDLTRQYRVLAARWHPDRNPGDAGATRRFQKLRAAMDLLTGADLSQLSGREVERITYEQILTTARVRQDVPDGHGGIMSVGFDLSVSMVVGEKFAADWIYAANLGADGRAFLAGYSGKIVVVSPAGIPERVYDIGAVPRHVVDAGDRLYILTDTRLYVVSGDRLDAMLDVYGAADVVVADTGFAVFEPKALTWYAPDGKRLGVVRTKDPLRRALSMTDSLVIETRQHRALVRGAPAWWA